jgi:glutamate--cysteine ligase catalytic subunit
MQDNFPGLIPIVEAYIDTLDLELAHLQKIRRYLEFIKRRSDGCRVFLQTLSWSLICIQIGRLVTPATWIRNFVRQHPDYKHDSVVSQEINYDLLKAVDEL